MGDGRTLTLLAVGDVLVDRPDPSTAYPGGDPAFARGDLVFGNCEGVYGAGESSASVTSGAAVFTAADNADALQRAGFDIMSVANNHALDGGPDGLASTMRELRRRGILTVGGGRDLTAAREPEVVVRNGVRVAFLACASHFPHGHEARPDRPGLAPIRSLTSYSQPPGYYHWDPGCEPAIATFELEEDRVALRESITAARGRADIVAVSFHWGDMFRPFVLRDHERRIGRLAVDFGADLVLGHHHHMWRGIEIYRGRPIWYGLGHHLFDVPAYGSRFGDRGRVSDAEDAALQHASGTYALGEREGYPLLPFHPDGRLTGVAVTVFDERRVRSVGLIPAMLGPDNVPRYLHPASEEGERVLDYLQRASTSAGLPLAIRAPHAGSGLPENAVQIDAA